MKSILVLLILCVITTLSYAQDVPDPVEVKLVSDIVTVKPGESFSLGALFEIEPGWHIYWMDPGDAGLPTKVEFRVPDGYKTGELNWPPPATYQNSKGGKEFGYEESVLLWSSIEVPRSAQINSSALIEAQLFWLSCNKICIPGKTTLKFELNISGKRQEANTKIFSVRQNKLEQ